METTDWIHPGDLSYYYLIGVLDQMDWIGYPSDFWNFNIFTTVMSHTTQQTTWIIAIEFLKPH